MYDTYWKVKDGLFIGNLHATDYEEDWDFFEENKVTKVINCAGEQLKDHVEYRPHIKFLTFDWLDQDDQIILDDEEATIHEISQFMEEAADEAESVLVQSVEGKSRSVCIVLAYLMHKFRWTTQKAIEYVSSRCDTSQMQLAFADQLYCLEQRLAADVSSPLTDCWDKDITKLSGEEAILQNTINNCRDRTQDGISPIPWAEWAVTRTIEEEDPSRSAARPSTVQFCESDEVREYFVEEEFDELASGSAVYEDDGTWDGEIDDDEDDDKELVIMKPAPSVSAQSGLTSAMSTTDGSNSSILSSSSTGDMPPAIPRKLPALQPLQTLPALGSQAEVLQVARPLSAGERPDRPQSASRERPQSAGSRPPSAGERPQSAGSRPPSAGERPHSAGRKGTLESVGRRDDPSSKVARFFLRFEPPTLVVEWGRQLSSPRTSFASAAEETSSGSCKKREFKREFRSEELRDVSATAKLVLMKLQFLSSRYEGQVESLLTRLAARRLPIYRILALDGAVLFDDVETSRVAGDFDRLPRGALVLVRERLRRADGWWVRISTWQWLQASCVGYGAEEVFQATCCEPSELEIRELLQQSPSLSSRDDELLKQNASMVARQVGIT